MPKRVEYQMPLPFTLEEYERGILYTGARMSLLEFSADQAVETLKTERFDDGQHTGVMTEKLISAPPSKIPGLLRAIIPAGATDMKEVSYDGFPWYHTSYSSPYFKDRLSMSFTSLHYEGGPGSVENAHGLCAKDRKSTVIKVIDIADPKYEKMEWYKRDSDPSLNEVAGRGPLVSGWMYDESAKHMMTAYKLLSVHVGVFGIGGKAQDTIHGSLMDEVVRAHRNLFIWADDWLGMTMTQVREYEARVTVTLSDKIRGLEDKKSRPTVRELVRTTSKEDLPSMDSPKAAAPVA